MTALTRGWSRAAGWTPMMSVPRADPGESAARAAAAIEAAALARGRRGGRGTGARRGSIRAPGGTTLPQSEDEWGTVALRAREDYEPEMKAARLSRGRVIA